MNAVKYKGHSEQVCSFKVIDHLHLIITPTRGYMT